MDVNVEISTDVFERLHKEKKSFLEELEAQGTKEGVAWAKSANYADLVEMYRLSSPKYFSAPGYHRLSGYAMLNDSKYGGYWRNVLLRYPLIAETTCHEFEQSNMGWEAECFFEAWFVSLETFYTRLQDVMDDYEDKMESN